jgi:hypothetical protein
MKLLDTPRVYWFMVHTLILMLITFKHMLDNRMLTEVHMFLSVFEM